MNLCRRLSVRWLSLLALLALDCSGCSSSPGRPAADAIPIDPDDIADFGFFMHTTAPVAMAPMGRAELLLRSQIRFTWPSLMIQPCGV